MPKRKIHLNPNICVREIISYDTFLSVPSFHKTTNCKPTLKTPDSATKSIFCYFCSKIATQLPLGHVSTTSHITQSACINHLPHSLLIVICQVSIFSSKPCTQK